MYIFTIIMFVFTAYKISIFNFCTRIIISKKTLGVSTLYNSISFFFEKI